MTHKHIMLSSAADVLEKTQAAFASNDADEQRDWARGFLAHSNAIEFASQRIEHSNSIDVNLISRVLATRCYELREEYEEDRPKLWFLDMFRDRNLFYPLQKGTMAYISRTYDYAAGPVRFIGDKTDDWPTTGGRKADTSIEKVKYYAKAVEYGILELWQAARDGRDIIGERVMDAYTDIDEFLELLISLGAQNHGFNGLLNHKDIPQTILPATTGPNAPNTDWPSKTPEEVIFDLRAIVDAVRVGSNYNLNPDTLIMSDKRFSYASVTQIGTNGDAILDRWASKQANAANGGLNTILPFVPYDTAGPGGTPVATAGVFDRRYIEMPLMPAEQLPTEYHGSKWKIGFIGAAGGVNIKRKGRFQTFTGL